MIDKITNQIASLPDDKKENPALKQVAKDFEAVFINQLIESMRKTEGRENSFIPESGAERTYRAMLDSQYAQQMAESEQIGLSKMIYDHLLRTYGGR